MELYRKNRAGKEAPPSDPSSERNPPVAVEKALQELKIGGGELYPERPGEQDCEHYIRTGYCRYRSLCRYNHPRRVSQVNGIVGTEASEYSERPNHQQVCQFFLKKGTCKFGDSCKYHHQDRIRGDDSATPATLNYSGYPLRSGEKECAYYLRTGHCKFGVACKFHHPESSAVSNPTSALPFHSQVQTPHVPSSQPVGVSDWQLVRPPSFPGFYVGGPYAPIPFSPVYVPMPGYVTYGPPPVCSEVSAGSQNVAASPFWPAQPIPPAVPAYLGPYSSFGGLSSSSLLENMFPEKPEQPYCRFFMKTGYCKFGSSCTYHHPRDFPRIANPLGLPMRPGDPPCRFYSKHGVCKFGHNCKYDHPLGTLSYSPSASSLVDMPVAPYPNGVSLATIAPSSSPSELSPEIAAAATSKEAYDFRLLTSENHSSNSSSSTFSKSGSGSQSYDQDLAKRSSDSKDDGGSSGSI